MRDYAKKQNWNVPVTARPVPIRPVMPARIAVRSEPGIDRGAKDKTKEMREPQRAFRVESHFSGNPAQDLTRNRARNPNIPRLRWVILGVLVILILSLTAKALMGDRSKEATNLSPLPLSVSESSGSSPSMFQAFHEWKSKLFSSKPKPQSTLPASASSSPLVPLAPPVRAQLPPPTVAPPQYDFYRILPNQREDKAPVINIDKTGPIVQNGYLIHLGTYGTAVAAGQVKAKLLLLGFSPSLARQSDGSFSVSLGPVATQNGASMIVRRLRSAGFSQITVNYLGG